MTINFKGVTLKSITAGAPVAPVDPYYANVVLLAHFDGADASTTFVDNSPSPKTMTSANGAAISTAQSVFGGASVRSTPSDSSRVVTQNTGFRLTGDYTIEFRVRMISVASGQYFFISNYVAGTSFVWFSTAASGKISVYTFGSYLPDSSASIQADTWYAIALTRSGTTTRLFINGQIVSESSTSVINQALDTGWSIGGPSSQMAGGSGNCFIDEVRITQGVARYTANYTVATEAFPNS